MGSETDEIGASEMESAMRSEDWSNLGEYPLLDFSWVVDAAIWSRTASYSGASLAHSFASVVNNALGSSRRDSPDHGFAISPVASPQLETLQNEMETLPLFDSVSRAGAQNQTKEVSSALIDIHNISPNENQYFKGWQKGAILGRGSFGTVFEGFTQDAFFFAVKEVILLNNSRHRKESISQLQQEISFLSRFQHKNIVRYLGTDKSSDNKLYIFLELVSKGSLSSLYQRYHLGDSQVSVYTRQILSALKYLHERNVVHRDIKCDNILVHVDGSIKLAGFGLATETKLNDVKSCKGSVLWMAPEVFKITKRGYGHAADIWSLGCTVLEMLTRLPPYSHFEGMQEIFRIGRGEPPLIPESFSVHARDFIIKCLQVNPDKRPTAAQLLNHPFVK